MPKFLLVVAVAILSAAHLFCESRSPLVVPRAFPIVVPTGDTSAVVLGGVEKYEFNSIFGIPLGTRSSVVEFYRTSQGSTDGTRAPFPVLKGSGLLNGSILACGQDQCATYTPTVDRWDIVEPPLIFGESYVLLRDGRVFTAGGATSIYTQTARVAIFDPNTAKWKLTNTMRDDRSGASYVRLLDGRVLVCGGYQSQFPIPSRVLRNAEVFDPSTEQWTQVAPMSTPKGGASGLLLADGRVFVGDTLSAEIYDPKVDRWQAILGLTLPPFSSLALLPTAEVLISGGGDIDIDGAVTSPLPSLTVFDPQTGAVRSLPGLRVARTGHTAITMSNGTVLLVGGLVATQTPTGSVESVAWEPQLTVTLDPGFYVATATQNQLADGGFWSLETQTAGFLSGGMNLGSVLRKGGGDVAFGAFYLPEGLTVTGTLSLLSLPKTSGSLDVTLQLFDVRHNAVGEALQATNNLNWSRNLSAGFYILEVRSAAAAPDMVAQMTLNASRLQAGAIAGGVLDLSYGVTGYQAFYLPSKQDVSIILHNENTYGRPRGAGEVYLTLYDASGRVLKSVGPGAPR